MNRTTKPDSSTGSTRVSQNAPRSKSVSDAVWNYIDTIPGAVERIERGEQQLAQGKKTSLRVIRNRG